MKKRLVILLSTMSFLGFFTHVYASSFDNLVEEIVMEKPHNKRITYINKITTALSMLEIKLLAYSDPSSQQKKILDIIPKLQESFEFVKNKLTQDSHSNQTHPTHNTTTTVNNTHHSHNTNQYTPNQADWSTFASKPKSVSSIKSHDPDGIGWLTPESRKKAERDGTTYDPTRMSKQAFAKAICPSGDQIRGIREVFYKHRPFADNKNPTKAEVDERHRIVINHVRALVGYTSEDRQVKKDHCLFARAQWGDERKYTTMRDAKYPDKTCVGSKNAHCGASFIPSAQDQKPYLPTNIESCGRTAGAEGVFGASKSNIPWSIKLSRTICSTIGQEGFWGGHTGPWFHREKFGISFRDTDPTNNNGNVSVRAKWSGKLMPSLYSSP